MKKALLITGVRTIFNIDRPIVVFEVQGHDAIVRNPKQALTDMQNSGRCLAIGAKALANGIEGLDNITRKSFIEGLLYCKGATLEGNITLVKAGDDYVVNAGHPALTDKNHPFFGKVQEGETLKAEKDGVWVDGFLTIALTEQEKMRRDVSGNIANAMLFMYGFGAQAPVQQLTQHEEFEDVTPVATSLPQTAASEAFETAETTADPKATVKK